MSHPYYREAEGLRFECTGCGACCKRPGPVFFPGPDLARAAAFLDLAPGEFRRRYRVRKVDGTPAMDPGDVPCPLYDDDRGCTIYDARPTQCRTFPFWPEIARRRRSWEKAARECEGIGRGRIHRVAEIEAHLEACAEVGLPREAPW